MSQIDPVRYLLLCLVFQGARWVGQEEYSFPPKLMEEWLRYIEGHGRLADYLPRFRGPARNRDDAFAEIATAHFLETCCGLKITEWHPSGFGDRQGDFLVEISPSVQMFVLFPNPNSLRAVQLPDDIFARFPIWKGERWE